MRTAGSNKQNGVAKTISKQDDWGYSLGGPVGKPGGSNKLFFFFSQEWRPRTTGGQVTRFRVPTVAERAGDFSQSRDNNGALFPYIRDPLTERHVLAPRHQAGCFADGGVVGKIPQNRLYAIGLNVLNMWPLPNDERGYAASGSYNYSSIKPHGQLAWPLQDSDAWRLPGVGRSCASVGKIITQDNSHEPNNDGIRFGTGTTSLIPGFNDMADWVPLMLQWSTTVNYNLNASTFFEALVRRLLQPDRHDADRRREQQEQRRPRRLPDAVSGREYHRPAVLLVPHPHRARRQRAAVLPERPVPGSAVNFAWGNRIANAPPNISDFGCCFTLNRVQDVTMSLTKVMGRHTAKAGFYLDHSYKPQTAGVGATGSYRGTVSFANDTNNPLDSASASPTRRSVSSRVTSRRTSSSKATTSTTTSNGTCRTTGR